MKFKKLINRGIKIICRGSAKIKEKINVPTPVYFET